MGDWYIPVEEKFCTDPALMEDLMCRYNLEDCGMSGLHPGWHWYQDDAAGVAVYYKEENYAYNNEKL